MRSQQNDDADQPTTATHVGRVGVADQRPANDPVPPYVMLPGANEGRGHCAFAIQCSDAAPSADGGDGHDQGAAHATPAVPALCAALRDLQASRVSLLRSIIRLSNAAGARVRIALGWRWDAPEAERARINKQAASIVGALRVELRMASKQCVPQKKLAAAKAIIETTSPRILAIARPHVGATTRALEPMEEYRQQLEAEMIRLAEQLPAAAWVNTINGAGMLGLAIVVGEAGDLSGYATPSRVWKRLGLAPSQCYAGRIDDKEVILKPKRRRSASYTVADALFKTDNYYSQLYHERREYEAARAAPDMVKRDEDGTLHLRRKLDYMARRYAEKRFLLHLWCAWNGKAISNNARRGHCTSDGQKTTAASGA
jgi:hypothetical protein